MKRWLNVNLVLIGFIVLALNIGFVGQIIPNLLGIQDELTRYYYRVAEGYIYNYMFQLWLFYIIWQFARYHKITFARRACFFFMGWIVFNMLFEISSVKEARLNYLITLSAIMTVLGEIIEYRIAQEDQD